MRIKIGKWSIFIFSPISIREENELNHECLNMYMDGTYECEYCYPEGIE